MSKPTMIIGASPKPDRYAHMAQRLLNENGHTAIPINPVESSILDSPAYRNPTDYSGPVDTVTLYVRPQRLAPMLEGLISIKPRRIIFNPGTDDPGLRRAFEEQGIETLEACTLVLLRTGQY
jgi:predicted CoA-binding protein